MSLVSYATYVRLTGDSTSASSDVVAALGDSVALLDDALDRHLTFGTYAETVKVGPRGLSYPKAIPVASVTASATYQVYDPATLHRVIPTSDDLVTTLDFPYLDHDWDNPHNYPTAIVIYDGGYTEATLPFRLKVAICLIARAMGTTGWTPPNIGAKSVGDVHEIKMKTDSEDVASMINGFVSGLWDSIRGFRRRSP